jgi:hypothetical protein
MQEMMMIEPQEDGFDRASMEEVWENKNEDQRLCLDFQAL